MLQALLQQSKSTTSNASSTITAIKEHNKQCFKHYYSNQRAQQAMLQALLQQSKSTTSNASSTITAIKEHNKQCFKHYYSNQRAQQAMLQALLQQSKSTTSNASSTITAIEELNSSELGRSRHAELQLRAKQTFKKTTFNRSCVW